MERGYLIAVLAIIATFTGFSRGFHSFEQWSVLHFRQMGAMARSECHANSAAQRVAKLKMQLPAHYAEEAQLLAELNLPARVQGAIASGIADPDVNRSHCLRVRAMQDSEQARRDMLRLQRDIAHVRIQPLSLQVNLPVDIERQVQQEMTARLAENQVKLRIAADQLNAIAEQSARPQQ
jgi:hypothetical protein